jgi:Acetyltransferase (GNAT) domain
MNSKVELPQADAGSEFFTSSNWYQPYVDAWPTESTRILQLDGSDSGAGFVVLSSVQRQTKLKWPYFALGVNVCLNEQLADVTLESNGAFGANTKTGEHWISTLFSSLNNQEEWDEVILPALRQSDFNVAQEQAQVNGWSAELMRDRPFFSTRFQITTQNSFPQIQENILMQLSSNTRAQIRRSIRQATEQFGSLSIASASNRVEVVQWLNILAAWHHARWGKTADAGGFSNPVFLAFQESLALTNLVSGHLRLHKVCAGSTVLGYLFNFQWRGAELFYVGAFNYQQASAIKPGLLSHFLAMCQAAQNGETRYEFLAGHHRYKESLSNEQGSNYDLRIRRKRAFFDLETKAKRILKRIRA